MDETLRRPPTASAFAPDQRIGPYRIVREIGRGGMGVVFLCEDTAIGDRQVALKMILDPQRGGLELAERFKREVKNLGKLRHPNIVQVLYAGEHEGHPYFVMEYVPGRELTRWLEEVSTLPEPARIDAIARLMIKVCGAVAHAHANGMVHRDLKPQNILVREDGEPLILDFGISKHQDDTTLTVASATPGTPSYMAPEQFEPQLLVDEKLIDIWSLGAILYVALTRERPFRGQSLPSVSYQVVHAKPIVPHKLNPSVPPALEDLVLSCLEKDPHRRPQSADDLAARLEAARHSARQDERRRRVRASSLIIIAVLVIGIVVLRPWTWWNRPPDISRTRAVLSSVSGRTLRGDETEVFVAGFQANIKVSVDALPPGAAAELVLIGSDGLELVRMPLNPAGNALEALSAIPLERQREGLKATARVLVRDVMVPLGGGATSLVFDATPPRIMATMEGGGTSREWPPDEVLEIPSGAQLRLDVRDPDGPVSVDTSADGREWTARDLSPGSVLRLAPEGADRWSVLVRARDAAGNEVRKRFDARFPVLPDSSASRPAAESRGAAWARLVLVNSQTNFPAGKPITLKREANRLRFNNDRTAESGLQWELRLLGKDGAIIRSFPMLPASLLDDAAPKNAEILGLDILGTTLPPGETLTAELVVKDAAGGATSQPLRDRAFVVEGKVRVRLKTSEGDIIIEVERSWSPLVTDAFLSHVKAGDYAGTIFHDVRRGQMVRGGIVNERLEDKKPSVDPEFPDSRDLKRQKPAKFTVAVYGKTELMINLRDNNSLELMNPVVFGRIAKESEAVVEKIAALSVKSVTKGGRFESVPTKPVIIQSAELLAP